MSCRMVLTTSSCHMCLSIGSMMPVSLRKLQTGEQSWMRMQSETERLLPDGRGLSSEDLFEGIWFGSG